MTGQIQAGLVSTIIPVFNRPQMIVEAVESVLAQHYRPIEIIVVDDGSTDGTPEILSKLALQHAAIKVFRQRNAGPGVARELGRQHAKGEFIQYLDSDDLLAVNKFGSQVAALQRNNTCVVAYGKTQRCVVGEPLNNQAIRNTGTEQAAMFPLFLRSRWWGTSTPLYRRTVLDKAGPWLDTINEEDWEYDCRVAGFGGRLVYVNEFVSIARQHSDHLSAFGASDPQKLQHRCIARQKIYQHALNYSRLDDKPSEISRDDWLFFSKSVFLLARQCALAGLIKEAKAMLDLSIQSAGTRNLKQGLFEFSVMLIGWRGAARLVTLIER